MTEAEYQKVCFKCGELKPLSAFYKHPRMADGRVNKCKECNKVDVRSNYKDKIDYYKEYDRKRSLIKGTKRHKSAIEYARNNNKSRRIKYSDLSEDAKKQYLIKQTERRLLNADRYKANVAVSNALRDGKLIKPINCESCGNDGKLHGHHSSYAEDMRLMVTWLCTKCHGEVHRKYD